jgi:hypothetical protein
MDTRETRIARLFGLHGENWIRHANPASVWTRFAVLPLLAAAVWSRAWIGWWSLVPIALVVAFAAVNPLLFPPPGSTRNWASMAVLGERVWAQRDAVPVPDRYRSAVPNVTVAIQLVGLAVLGYGLVRFDAVATVAGLVVVQCAKAWFLDRMVFLFDDVRGRPEFAAWDR